MCARYELTTPPERMIERFGLIVPDEHGFRKPRAFERGEIRPTNLAPVISSGGEISMLPWGLSVSWQSQPLINARSETLATKPTFKHLLGQRCLVPASAYFEWRKDGKRKIKTRINPANDNLFAMAGLIGDGRFTIITSAPSPAIAHIHDRMPVIMSQEAEARWLDARVPFTELAESISPYRGQLTFEEENLPLDRQGQLFA